MATWQPVNPNWYEGNELGLVAALSNAQSLGAQSVASPSRYEPRARGFVKNTSLQDQLANRQSLIDELGQLVDDTEGPQRFYDVEGLFRDNFGNITGSETRRIEDPNYDDLTDLYSQITQQPDVYSGLRDAADAQTKGLEQSLLAGVHQDRANQQQVAQQKAIPQLIQAIQQRRAQQPDPMMRPLQMQGLPDLGQLLGGGSRI